MSAPNRPSDDQDPDYVSPAPSDAKQQKVYEENARAKTANKITAIVEKEFSKEIDAKEKEVLLIQNRLHKALKTLHLLRYVVITDFYNRKQCRTTSQSSESKQTRIHPAIKRLIGKSPKRQKTGPADQDAPCSSGQSQYVPELHETETTVTIKEEPASEVKDERPEVKKRLGQGEDSLESDGQTTKEEDGEPRKKIPRYIPPRSSIPEMSSPARGLQHKVRKRIVVGNISKWIPPDWREDAASHKWMMYVRGSKEDADISDFVGKVRFFLHPSYQPNDVVEVTSPPFHLSRRGWGEFPLRVQLHFKNILNKPMDIIHYLKLDRTYTGLQTLGSETVVDIWIHTTDPCNIKKALDLMPCSKNTLHNSKVMDFEIHEIDMSIVKKESEETQTSVVSSDHSKISSLNLKTEPTENLYAQSKANSTYDFYHSIRSDHNYVRNEHLGMAFHSENNVTIKHSSQDLKSPLKNNKSLGKDTLGSCTSEVPCNDKNTMEDHVYPLSADDSTTSTNSHENVEENQPCNGLQLPGGTKVSNECRAVTNGNDGVNLQGTILDGTQKSSNKNISKAANRASTEGTLESRVNPRSLLKDAQNGNAAELKLLKCKDKIFLMTDAGESPKPKKILAGQVLPSNMKIQGNSSGTPNKILTLGKSQRDEEKVKELKSVNVIEQTAQTSQNYKARNSPSDILMDDVNAASYNLQRISLQKLASTLKALPSGGDPLKITIPPAFESVKRKQVVLLKSNRLIPVAVGDSTIAVSVDSSQEVKNPTRLPKLMEGGKDSETIGDGSLMSASSGMQSLLKKKPAMNMLRINSSNSVMLNSTSDVPALQIANRSRFLAEEDVAQKLEVQVKLRKVVNKGEQNDSEDCTPVKAKVTLGKDKNKMTCKKEAYRDILRSIDHVQINDFMGTLKYIIRRVPLISRDAEDPEYKRIHPYACSTEGEFFTWNLGKQRALEWYRAKTVKSLLRKKGFADEKLWSIKEIILWARLHGYTPVQSCFEVGRVAKTTKKMPETSSATTSTYSEPVQLNEWLDSWKDSKSPSHDNDIEIDVVNIVETKTEPGVKIDPMELAEDMTVLEAPDELQTPLAFVNETAREIGVKLGPEEVVPGVMHDLASRMILQAVKCMADDVVRLSLAKAWERSSGRCPETIALDDVRAALLSREEFDVFTNAGLASQQDGADR